jgi:hypothetical protein
MKTTLIVLLSILSIPALAQIGIELDRETLLTNTSQDSTPTINEADRFPEIYNFNDSALRDRSDETGVHSEAYFTQQDSSSLSISAHFSYDYEDLSKVQSYELIYQNRFDNSYQDLWWGAQVKYASAKYSAIADERTSSTGSADSVASIKRNDELQTFSIFGVGLGNRFKALSNAFGTNRFYEMIMVYGNYILHSDATDQEKYTGYGYNADYLFSYRQNNGLFYGAKISYNWLFVQKAQKNEEKLIDRSLVFGWTSIGLEIGYYF